MIRRALAVAPALLATALLVAGCGSDEAPPQVTFSAGPASVVAEPTQYCSLQLTDCRADETAPVSLAVPVGTTLKVVVPDGIATTPWQVVFVYRDAANQQVDGRSPVFAPDKQQSYELLLPAATDRLLSAQVQQYGPPPAVNAETGEVEFPIRASWVLTATSA